MAERKHIRISIISVWVGILIPIVAAIIPYAIGYFTPEHKLEFQLVGPISVKGTQALQINISNNGGKVEKGVKVWLKSFPTYELPDSLRPKGEKKKEPTDLLAVDSKTNVTVTKDRDYYVLSVGDIRPKEEVSISIVARESRLALHGFRDSVSGLEVKSDEHIAGFKGLSVFEEVLYPFGFWMFVILMVLILILAFYQEYFMDPKTREKMILKEIDKLEK